MPIDARLNTTQAFIPLLSSQIGENVLRAKEEDKNFVVRYKYVGESIDKDIGIPCFVFGQNVMPTLQGISSVGYLMRLPEFIDVRSTAWDDVLVLQLGHENKVLFCPAQGKNLVSRNNSWVKTRDLISLPGICTSGFASLRTFLFYQRQELFEFDPALGVPISTSFNGLEPANIDGITNSNNFLIAWNQTTVFWSSTIDPLDFVPSLSSGAGSENPTPVRGKIVACLPATDGFVIYTTANAVMATWSGNIRFPWKFTEISGSAGIEQIQHVTYEANYPGHIAWTTAGLQLIQKSGAQQLLPEVTDFLAGRKVEEYLDPVRGYQNFFNEAAVSFDSVSQDWGTRVQQDSLLKEFSLPDPPKIKVALIASRYLVISYGWRREGLYDYAIVQDMSLSRFGKLKITHHDAFQYFAQAGETVTPRDSIGFLCPNGLVRTLDFSHREASEQGILILGRLKHQHGRGLELLEYGFTSEAKLELSPEVLISPDDINFYLASESHEKLLSKNISIYECRASGSSLGFLIRGKFSLTGVSMQFNLGGDR